MSPLLNQLAQELAVPVRHIEATVALLDEGATVPFVARYRKEVTGGLDDTQLRTLEQRLGYLRELEDRRGVILNSIREQGKLTDELEAKVLVADSKGRLEDLYLPYKPKRRTKGQIAIEAGLEPLANGLFENPNQVPETSAEAFVNVDAGVATVKEALDGARYILMERFAEDADLIARLRAMLWQDGELVAAVVAGKEAEGQKFSDYFEHRERLSTTPSHRALAMFRGRSEGVLNLRIELPGEAEVETHPAEGVVARHIGLEYVGRAAERWLMEVVRWTWKIKLYLHLELDLFGQLRDQAESDAIGVFAANLKDLLLAAPAGPRATIGLDPGLRTGVKVAVVDATGKVVDYNTIYPTAPQRKIAEAEAVLLALIDKHEVELIAIGNGTASRETEKFVVDMLKQHGRHKVSSVMVNESGASIYSASAFAAQELPDLDVTIRGAVSIARRLQDPLAELVKIEPKSIGVGQYQHDVSQVALSRSLDAVIEDCVNAVGVDVNTASSALLSRVSGLTTATAANMVSYRDQNGMFTSRDDLRAVPRIGDKTFEQAAGFLRVMNGSNPLDRSAVHPESYPVVDQMAAQLGCEPSNLLGNSASLGRVKPEQLVTDAIGLPTITDILRELEKPGRDPRPEFKTARFREGIEKLSDLQPDMVLEGVVTNVTNFGAFVDIGVHQDGLVHISALANRFVKDPREVVKAGDIVRVKVMEVDVQRKRVGLSMRLDDSAESVKEGNARAANGKPNGASTRRQHKGGGLDAGRQGPAHGQKGGGQAAAPTTGFAEAFANAKKTRS